MEQQHLFEEKGETLIIYLPEELDHHAAGVIREETESLFICKKIRDVIFDYTNTHFMDSSGIGLVMGRYRQVRYLKGDVYIVGVNEKIARILDISGLYRVAKKCENIDAALQDIEEKKGRRKEK
ncbi:MAG: anti-sigma factor antagonist [Clostridiales bacterium]|nr:anti-sigma factor antagonist [Clostridiales bacterium]